MHSDDWSRSLTERQREVLSIVVENKVYRNRDSRIPELAAQMGIAPSAVANHLLEIEKNALLLVPGSPWEQGKRVYERLQLEPRPARRQTAEALDPPKIGILRFLRDRPDASANEIAEELRLSGDPPPSPRRAPVRVPADGPRPRRHPSVRLTSAQGTCIEARLRGGACTTRSWSARAPRAGWLGAGSA